MRTRWLLVSVGLALFVLLGAIACGGANKKYEPKQTAASTKPTQTQGPAGTPAESAVTVNLTEYIVAPKPTSVPAGRVTFHAKNIGTEDHQLYVLRTNLQPEALPTKADGSADEAGAGVELIDEIESFARNTDETLTTSLAPGSYVLICNVVKTNADGTVISHYHEGMHAAFAVTQ